MDLIAVALVDRSRLLREGLRALLRDAGFDVVAEADEIEDLDDRPGSEQPPRMVLLTPSDLGRPEAAVTRLRAVFPDARIVVLTETLTPLLITGALEAEVDGILMRDISPDVLVRSLRLIMTGERILPAGLASLPCVPQAREATPAASQQKALLVEDIEILRCLVEGDSNKVIADRLGTTETAIKVQLQALMRKINVTNRTQAALWALRKLDGAGSVSGADARSPRSVTG